MKNFKNNRNLRVSFSKMSTIFEDEQLIGIGNTSVVKKCKNPENDKEFALKIVFIIYK